MKTAVNIVGTSGGTCTRDSEKQTLLARCGVAGFSPGEGGAAGWPRCLKRLIMLFLIRRVLVSKVLCCRILLDGLGNAFSAV